MLKIKNIVIKTENLKKSYLKFKHKIKKCLVIKLN